MEKYICYIDESGDEGFKETSSQSFAFGCIIIRKSKDIMLPTFKKDILREISIGKNLIKDIHFSHLDHEKRKYLCEEMINAKLPIRSVITLIQKSYLTPQLEIDFNNEKYKFYNYTLRFLLERISWFIRDNRESNDEQVKIIFSNRKQFDMNKISNYIQKIKSESFNKCRIDWSTIGSMDVKNHDQIAGLQLADVFVSAFRRFAFDGSRYGRELSYIKTLKPFLYNRNGIIETYGLKILANKIENDTKKVLIEDMKFKIKG